MGGNQQKGESMYRRILLANLIKIKVRVDIRAKPVFNQLVSVAVSSTPTAAAISPELDHV